MSSNTQSSNLTSGFIDLATYDETEKYLYGGDTSVSYFLKKLRKSTWFTVVPTVLSISGGNPGFGTSWGYKISRAGDYLLRSWLRIQIPSVSLIPSTLTYPAPPIVGGVVAPAAAYSLRWTRNLGHNIIREINIAFNDLVAERMDSYFLDFWSAFTIPAGKRNGYENMIGNVAQLNNPNSISLFGPVQILPEYILNVPLPFFYQRDTGVALPTAAIPYNDMIHNVYFRDIPELLIIDDTLNHVSYPCQYSNISTSQSIALRVDMWAEYAIVANVERSQMGKAPRDILIEQVQTAPAGQFIVNSTTTIQADIRFSHAIKALFFSIRNKTNQAERSNYTAGSPVPFANGVQFNPAFSSDPIVQTSLFYENTARLVQMGSDYFSFVVPFYTAISIPTETGYHMLSYTLNLVATNPMGSTNYGKLTNVSLSFAPSADAISSASVVAPATAVQVASGAASAQAFESIVVGLNHNIIRISGGALGFPIL
jgi:Major capsid protein N-terminus/Large eukaryotic DNA virus major capsid protein